VTWVAGEGRRVCENEGGGIGGGGTPWGCVQGGGGMLDRMTTLFKGSRRVGMWWQQ